MARAQFAKSVLTTLSLILGLACASPVGARTPGSPEVSPAPTVSVRELPPQGQEMYELIFRGGPFRYEKDGVVFGNRERLLPMEKRGYYHEYTVRTPGSRDRGARRIVCGGAPTQPDNCFYTDDHYASFRRIVH